MIRGYLTHSVPRDHRKLDILRSRLIQRYKKLDLVLGGGDYPKVRSALEVWKEIYRALNQRERQEYGRHFRVLRMEVKQRSALVRIEVNEQATFDKISQQFERSPYLREEARDPTRVVQVGAAQFVDGHWQADFEFRFKERD